MRITIAAQRGVPSIFRWVGTHAFTLPEMMVSAAIFAMLLGTVISCQLFGLRLYQIGKAKLGVSDDARRSVGKLLNEIRSAKVIDVGTGAVDSFTEAALGTLQQGNAIQIYPSTNFSAYIRYFVDPADKELKRVSTSEPGIAAIASSLSNTVVFTAEDHLGNVLTNNQNNRVIGVRLQFYQIAYPVVPIGPGALFDYYQLRTRITRRTLE